MHQACEQKPSPGMPRLQPPMRAMVAASLLFFATVLSTAFLVSPVCTTASTKVHDLGPSTASSTAGIAETEAGETPEKAPQPPQSPASSPSGVPTTGPREIILIATIALLFAWLRVTKDFRHYRGLLHTLLSSGYTWVFLIIIAATTFVLDWLFLPLLESFRALHGIAHPVLALGHIGISSVSSAFAGYGSPILLARIPLSSGSSSPAPDRTEKRNPEKTTEMNAIFEAMRESLEGRVNGMVSDWALKYDWPVLKYVANTLVMGLESMPSEEKEALCKVVGAYTKDADDWQDRQRKYELLRKMMAQTSFQDLRRRLTHIEKAS